MTGSDHASHDAISKIASELTRDTAILYQNELQTVVLFDIPRSIAQAQGSVASARILNSSKPLQQPFPSTEPKTEAARQRVLQRIDPLVEAVHRAVSPAMLEALGVISESYQGPWCLPRSVTEAKGGTVSGKKRKPSEDTDHDTASAGDTANAEPQNGFYQCTSNLSPSTTLEALLLESPISFFPSFSSLNEHAVVNEHSCMVHLSVADRHKFLIPPNSTFVLGRVQDTCQQIIKTCKKLLPPDKTHEAGRFDFILLDPPWSNRSVRRSKYYKTAEDELQDPSMAVFDILSDLIATDGMVAVWVTNNASTRRSALKAFEEAELDLIEEWIWLKTTIDGLPVTELNGIWRRPYEILLLGRKRKIEQDDQQPSISPTRRVIVAVPDLHSRKPCVKELVEPLFQKSYRALEVFARHLTAGWWAWGDEVLKFNSSEQWEEHSIESN